jgi:eukaryotic-like serine/threonine-protein kinase
MEPEKLGRYEIIGVLGQGAMGVVYKARDPLLDRVVAIKTINMALEQEEMAEYQARFEQEARAAGGLNHPNVITIYDIASSGDIAYMAMEFLEGRELRNLLVSGTPLPVAQAVDIAAQVADGLVYAHEKHIVHRDIKPANIMIVRDGRAKITDFGIARMRSSQVKTETGMVMGSPKYMSPEQVMGLRADGRSDIFSLGVMLYEMLTGASPFSGDSITALMFQTLNTTPPAPRMVNTDVPEMLNFVVAKAIAKKADDRYQNAADFASDLRECARQLGAAPASAKPAPRPRPATPSELAREEAKTQVLNLLNTAPHTRHAEVDAGDEEAPVTLGVSTVFDSYDATLRVAAQTGMSEELNEFAKTQKVARPAAQVPASSTPAKIRTGRVKALPAPAPAVMLGLSKQELQIVGGIVAGTLAVALLIVFV